MRFLLSFPGKPRIIESDLYWKELIAGAREREARSFENKIKYDDINKYILDFRNKSMFYLQDCLSNAKKIQ